MIQQLRIHIVEDISELIEYVTQRHRYDRTEYDMISSLMIQHAETGETLYVGSDEFRAIEALEHSFTRNVDITQDEALNTTVRNILLGNFTHIPEHDILRIRVTQRAL